MLATDLRNATYDSLKADLNARRLEVLAVWSQFGPGTTRQIAEVSGWDILSFRPRTTALYQVGLLALIDREGSEGVYIVRNQADWESWRSAQFPLTSGQLALF